jgi:3-deoxy-7-phosphoheptulonate synthase
MHANTYTSESGRKTRDFERICHEIEGFVRAHSAEHTWPGGIHVELTGDNVTECIGGADKVLDSQLDDRYQTVCDPRLNGRQSLDLAFHVSELLRDTGLA